MLKHYKFIFWRPSRYWCYIDILPYPAHKWNCLSYLQNYTLKIIQEIISYEQDEAEKRQKQKLTGDLIAFERESQREIFSLAVFLPLLLKIYST